MCTSTLEFEEFERLGLLDVLTPNRVALVLANLIADKESKSDGQKGVHLLLLLLRVGIPSSEVLVYRSGAERIVTPS
jgi:hypothetical protein